MHSSPMQLSIRRIALPSLAPSSLRPSLRASQPRRMEAAIRARLHSLLSDPGNMDMSERGLREQLAAELGPVDGHEAQIKVLLVRSWATARHAVCNPPSPMHA